MGLPALTIGAVKFRAAGTDNAHVIEPTELLAPPAPSAAPGLSGQVRRRTLVSVVLPAFEEEQNLRRLLPRLRAVLGACSGWEFEALVVDDGSRDATAAVAGEFGARVIRHPQRLGNGAAVKRGIREARGEWVLLMDADGQHPPEEIPRLLQHAPAYDMIVGARSRGAGWHRDLANRIYNALASYVTGRAIADLTSGFRLVRAAPLRAFLYMLPNTFSYPTTITMAMARSGFALIYVPFAPARRAGKSKIRLLRDGGRFLLIIMKVATLVAPLRIFMPLALGVWLAGALYYVYTFLTSHRFTNMGLLLLVQGSILFVLGLISEQVAQLRYERSGDGWKP